MSVRLWALVSVLVVMPLAPTWVGAADGLPGDRASGNSASAAHPAQPPASQPSAAQAAAPATQPGQAPANVRAMVNGQGGQVMRVQVGGNGAAANGVVTVTVNGPVVAQGNAPATQPAAGAPATQPNGQLQLQVGGGKVFIQGPGGGQFVIQGQVAINGQVVQIGPGFQAPPPTAALTLPGPPVPLVKAVALVNPAEVGVAIRTVSQDYARAKIKSLALTGEGGQSGQPGKGSGGSLQADGDGQKIELKMEDVVRIDVQPDQDRLLGDRLPDDAVAVLLTDGEWLAGSIKSGDARQVRLAVVGLGELGVPLRGIRAVVAPAGRAGPGLLRLERRLLAEPPASPDGESASIADTIRLANGETVAGTVVEINAKGLTVQGPAGNLDVGFDVLTVAELSNQLTPAAGRDLPLAAWVETVKGNRLLASRLDWRGGSIKITRLDGGEPLTVPEGELWSIESVNGRWHWLDDMTPVLSTQKPFLTHSWPARFGLNVVGEPIRLGQQPYSHGIGVHSESTLVFEVKGATRFHCLAGLDASAGPLAEVELKILLDGKPVLERKPVKFGEAPISVDLPLNGAQKLELRVGFGPSGDVQGRFDWADAAVLY